MSKRTSWSWEREVLLENPRLARRIADPGIGKRPDTRLVIRTFHFAAAVASWLRLLTRGEPGIGLVPTIRIATNVAAFLERHAGQHVSLRRSQGSNLPRLSSPVENWFSATAIFLHAPKPLGDFRSVLGMLDTVNANEAGIRTARESRKRRGNVVVYADLEGVDSASACRRYKHQG